MFIYLASYLHDFTWQVRIQFLWSQALDQNALETIEEVQPPGGRDSLVDTSPGKKTILIISTSLEKHQKWLICFINLGDFRIFRFDISYTVYIYILFIRLSNYSKHLENI